MIDKKNMKETLFFENIFLKRSLWRKFVTKKY